MQWSNDLVIFLYNWHVCNIHVSKNHLNIKDITLLQMGMNCESKGAILYDHLYSGTLYPEALLQR